MQTITVRTARPYPIHIGRGLLAEYGRLTLEVKKPCRVLLVTDSNVAPLYLSAAAESFRAAGFTVFTHVFPAGESSKNIGTLTNLLNTLGENGFTRGDLAAALGGGVTGDLTGFAAAVYQRGIDYIQLPTTVLAAVDSSVGGKTAVDLSCGKNMAGCFWQPRAVLCDCDTFASLPPAVFADGMAEVIKYGVILDEALWSRLEHCDVKADIETIVARCCELKRQVVEEDERDTGRRALLNFGHTIGHAVEKVSGFAVAHGHGVAIGMVAMARAAERHGCAETGTAMRIATLCERCGLSTKTELPAASLAAAAHSDKKRLSDGITVVVPLHPGAAGLKELSLSALDEWIGEGVARP